MNIEYSDIGEGFPLVLLHGYLETHEIWNHFAEKLAKKNRVISFDLLGHGGTGVNEGPSTMEAMAEAVKEILDILRIKKCIVIGHSMGGYATLAMVELYPELISAFCLFHSVPFADTEEKKINRKREIELVSKGKKSRIIKVNIPRMFANDNVKRLKSDIEKIKNRSLQFTNEGIIKALEGMILRKDRISILEQTTIPYLWVLGKKDNYIAYETTLKRVNVSTIGKVEFLENSGHCGFIEEPEASLEIVRNFVEEYG